MLSLGELLDHHDFGLQLRTGGDRARERRITGAHASETPDPSRFLPEGWVMLTLGLRLRNHVAEQRRLVVELDKAGLCALGFGTGVAFRRIPPALLDEAARRGYPVFHIPFETPYREIVSFVNHSLLSSDYRTLHRSLSMQNYLMDALREPRPVEVLVTRLAELLRSRVLIFRAGGQLEADSGTGPVQTVWNDVQQRDPSLQRALVDDAEVLSVRIRVHGHLERWLVVASQRRTVPTQLALSVIQTTERLLEVITLSRHAAASEERTLRAELLSSALQPHAGYDSLELRARIERFGIDLASPTRVFCLEPRDARTRREDLEHARRLLEQLLGDAEVPYLMAARQARLVALTPAHREDVRAWLARLDEEGVPLRAGGGRVVAAIEEAPQSYRDAQLALQQLARGADEPVLLFEDFGLANWLLGITPPKALEPKVRDALGELERHPKLHETLVAFLAADTSIAATAATLNLHQNSLRYRLARIEEIVGRPLRELSTLVDLYLATLATRPPIADSKSDAQDSAKAPMAPRRPRR